jgi:hypothetical protein
LALRCNCRRTYTRTYLMFLFQIWVSGHLQYRANQLQRQMVSRDLIFHPRSPTLWINNSRTSIGLGELVTGAQLFAFPCSNMTFWLDTLGNTWQPSWLRHYARSRNVAGSIPYESLDFYIAEISTRNLPECKGLPVLKADSLTAICEPIVKIYVIIDISQPCGPPLPITRITLPLTSYSEMAKLRPKLCLSHTYSYKILFVLLLPLFLFLSLSS